MLSSAAQPPSQTLTIGTMRTFGHACSHLALACFVTLAVAQSASGQSPVAATGSTRPMPLTATLTDAAAIAAASYASGAAGVLVAFALSENACENYQPGPDFGVAAAGCLFAWDGPFREGWYGGLALGFTVGTFVSSRARKCSLLEFAPRLIGGAVAGSIPAVVTLNVVDRHNVWRGRVIGFTPLMQSAVTAVLLRSCSRTTSGGRPT